MIECQPLHGTHPHADPIDFIFKYQIYWCANDSLVGLPYLLFTYQFCLMTASLGSYYFSSLFYQLTPSFSNWGDIGPSRPYWVRVLFFRTWPASDCTGGVALLRFLKSMDDDFVRPLGRAEYCARCCTWTTYLNTLIVLSPRSSCLDDLVTWALPL